jgi:hypothetical protein
MLGQTEAIDLGLLLESRLGLADTVTGDKRVYKGLNSSPVACQKPIALYYGARHFTTYAVLSLLRLVYLVSASLARSFSQPQQCLHARMFRDIGDRNTSHTGRRHESLASSAK